MFETSWPLLQASQMSSLSVRVCVAVWNITSRDTREQGAQRTRQKKKLRLHSTARFLNVHLNPTY